MFYLRKNPEEQNTKLNRLMWGLTGIFVPLCFAPWLLVIDSVLGRKFQLDGMTQIYNDRYEDYDTYLPSAVDFIPYGSQITGASYILLILLVTFFFYKKSKLRKNNELFSLLLLWVPSIFILLIGALAAAVATVVYR
jgi:hypothetical protein